jgi:hypothetical protein
MPQKKQKKQTNGVHKKTNGVHKKAAVAPTKVEASPAPVQKPSYRDLKSELEREVLAFRQHLLSKYTDFHGIDMRKDVAWYLEQYGNGILSEIEREKRKERDRVIAANRIPELEKQLEDETLTAQYRESIEEQLIRLRALLAPAR